MESQLLVMAKLKKVIQLEDGVRNTGSLETHGELTGEIKVSLDFAWIMQVSETHL